MRIGGGRGAGRGGRSGLRDREGRAWGGDRRFCRTKMFSRTDGRIDVFEWMDGKDFCLQPEDRWGELYLWLSDQKWEEMVFVTHDMKLQLFCTYNSFHLVCACILIALLLLLC